MITPCENGCNGCDECTDFDGEDDFDEECQRCHCDGRYPWSDHLMPCPECQGETL